MSQNTDHAAVAADAHAKAMEGHNVAHAQSLINHAKALREENVCIFSLFFLSFLRRRTARLIPLVACTLSPCSSLKDFMREMKKVFEQEHELRKAMASHPDNGVRKLLVDSR